MKCGGCVRAVERTLLEQPGVQRADVNLVSRAAWLDLSEADGDVDAVLGALASRGFPARERSLEPSSARLAAGASGLTWWQQWRQLMVALTLLLLSVLGHLSEAGHLSLPLIGSLPFHAALATVALLGPGRPILLGGFAAARAAAPSMDTLVGLGVGSAYLASLVALIWPQVGWPCFFNEPVMLLGFVLLGRFLEERARFRTGQALHQLAQLQPDTARLVLPDGAIRDVRVGALRPGERLQLLAGDRVPVDGVVVEGYSAVDASSLTGEPLPWQAEPGLELSAGSLNLDAPLVLEVTRVGAETALARIIRLVEQAQARRAPIQGLADRVGGVKTLFIGSVLQCLGLIFYLPSNSMMSLYAVSLMFGLAQGGIVPSYALIVREYLPGHEAGSRVGFVLMTTILGMALGGWMSGWIYVKTGSYELAFINGIVWNLLNMAIAGFFLWWSKPSRPAPILPIG